jgi:hypothetical protein
MLRPVRNPLREDRAEKLVVSDARIKTLDKKSDEIGVDAQLFGVGAFGLARTPRMIVYRGPCPSVCMCARACTRLFHDISLKDAYEIPLFHSLRRKAISHIRH